VLIPVLSKTYAPGGTSPPLNVGGRGKSIPTPLICRNPPCRNLATLGAAISRRNTERTPMMDVLMLAIAAGLFAAGIGYAYVCDRL
jgi:hypothetical protein